MGELRINMVMVALNRVNLAFGCVLICLAFASADSEKWLQDEWLQEEPATEAAAPWLMTGVFKGKEWCWENFDGREGLKKLMTKVNEKHQAKHAKKGWDFSVSSITQVAGEDCPKDGYTHAAWAGKKGGNGVTGELGNKRYSKLLEDDKVFEALLQEWLQEEPATEAAAPWLMTGVFKGKEWCWENFDGPEGLKKLMTKVNEKHQAKHAKKGWDFSVSS